MAVATKTPPTPMQCDIFVRGELCRWTAGHHGQHEPGDFTGIQPISGRKAAALCNRVLAKLGGPRTPFWRGFGRARCPHCHAAVHDFYQGTPTIPVLENGTSRREWTLTLSPCGHQFRWVRASRAEPASTMTGVSA